MSSSDQKESKKKPKRWLIGLIIILLLLMIGFAGREKVQKGITAWVIYRKHVFIPPPKNTGESSVKQFANMINY